MHELFAAVSGVVSTDFSPRRLPLKQWGKPSADILGLLAARALEAICVCLGGMETYTYLL